MLSVESQKGTSLLLLKDIPLRARMVLSLLKQFFIEDQKGTITIDFVQQ